MDLMIRDAKLLINGHFIEASIAVNNGLIQAIIKDPGRYVHQVDKVIDAKGLPIIPGGIDIHAHIYDPDYTHHEDWKTGSLAAAFGGLTTIYDMPLRMFIDSVDKLKLKIETGLRDSYVNFGIHAGMMRGSNLASIPDLAKEGVVGYKVFTLGREWMASDQDIIRIMELVRDHNGVVMVHAEDHALVEHGLQLVEGRNDPLAHHEARSDFAEALAIAKVGYYASYTLSHVHIVHLTSMLGVYMVEHLWLMGTMITAETCPQYLYFTRDDVNKWGNYLKIAPSLKTRIDVEALWDAVARGVVDAITSDHAPAPREEKEADVWSAWGGIPVIELIVPFMYTFGVKQGRIDFNRFIEVTSTNPARIMRLYPRKGVIAVGSDADLVVLDTNLCKKIKADQLHQKVDWTPFEDIEMYGWARHVIINGEIVIEDMELVGKPGIGHYVGEYFKNKET